MPRYVKNENRLCVIKNMLSVKNTLARKSVAALPPERSPVKLQSAYFIDKCSIFCRRGLRR